METGWMSYGKCRGQDPQPWDGIPVNDHWNSPLDFSGAKAVCDTCPVSVICAETAIQSEDVHTMRGGLTPAELKRMVTQ
jgi:hypothetical protein